MKYVSVGDFFTKQLPMSEVCSHMNVAGKTMDMFLLSDIAVQLHTEDGTDFSFPILPSEAGLYWDDTKEQHYYHD